MTSLESPLALDLKDDMLPDINNDEDIDHELDMAVMNMNEEEASVGSESEPARPMKKSDKNSNDFVYKVNLDILSDHERKSFATNILHCFSAVRNRWSTDEQLAVFYQKFRPGTARPSVVNVRENKNDWNRKAKKLNMGHEHDDETEADGCSITERHRVCKRSIEDGDDAKEESRIHPSFAEEIFSESEVTVKDITVPIRNFKRKRVELPMSPEEEEITKRLKTQTTNQKRLISKLKRKLDEAQKVKEEMLEAEKILNDLREEVLEKERELRKAIKGKPPVVEKEKEKEKPKIDKRKKTRGLSEDTLDDETDDETETLPVKKSKQNHVEEKTRVESEIFSSDSESEI